MRALILMLRKADAFRKDADLVERAWKEFCEIMGYRASAEYRQCYSERLLSLVVDAAYRGIKGIGLIAAAENSDAPIVALLNQAWSAFWNNPGGYQKWEAEHVQELKTPFGSERFARVEGRAPRRTIRKSAESRSCPGHGGLRAGRPVTRSQSQSREIWRLKTACAVVDGPFGDGKRRLGKSAGSMAFDGEISQPPRYRTAVSEWPDCTANASAYRAHARFLSPKVEPGPAQW
jgi:hypothetical protein